jgi:hypothetical protein
MTGERNLTCHGGHDRGDAAVVRVAALPLSGTLMPSITCKCKYSGRLNEVEHFVNALIVTALRLNGECGERIKHQVQGVYLIIIIIMKQMTCTGTNSA